jgi:rhodanese-related sulfurtransferase
VPTEVDLTGLDKLLASDAQLVEVLPAKEFEEEHLPGAASIPLKKIDPSSVEVLDHAHAVVTYCWDSL